ncbi:MAG: PAS domain S-box protein [Sneathiella sp.]|nr:PAS domain S-box protein [Sneathiella sp.]
MIDRHSLDISSAISDIEKKRQKGFSTLGAIVAGITSGFHIAGTAIFSLKPFADNLQILAQYSEKTLFPDSDAFLRAVSNAYASKSFLDDTVWHSCVKATNQGQDINFVGRMIYDSKQIPLGYLILWNNHPIELDTLALNFLSLIGLSIDTHFEKYGSYDGRTDLSEAFEAIDDGIIVYDQDDYVVAYNGKQQELFPSFASHLKIGVAYEELLRKQSDVGQISKAIGREEEWIQERKSLLKKHNYSTEQEFENGRTMRLTHYRTQSGGSVAVRTDITELVQAKRQSAKNEKQVRAVLELNPDAIIVQADGVTVYANQRAIEIFAADSAEAILNVPGLSFVHPDERDTILRYRNRIISGENSSHKFETRHLRMDGTAFHSEMNIGSVSWKGRPGTINIIRDITARKEAEAAILRQDEEMTLAQQLGCIGHWRLTLATNNLEWSDELYNIYGLDKETTNLTVDFAHSRKPREDAANFSKMVEGFLKGKRATDFEYRIIRSDGEIRNLRGSIKPDYDNDGNVISVFGVSQDVTAQKEVERARDASNERFKDLAELGADWFWEMDAELRFSYFSDRLHRVTGQSTDRYIGKTREEIGQGTINDERWMQHLEDLGNHRPFKNFRYTHFSETGQEFFWKISGKPIFSQNGTFQGYRGTGTDITAQTLMKEKLNQSQKMEAVGQLTGGVAHDFNNLLGVIQGNAELLLETAAHLSNKEKGFLEAVIKATGRGAELTQSMLAFSRKQSLVPKTIYLDKQIQDMTKILQRTLGQAISVKVTHQDNLWACTADPGQVENALLNLSLNARDAMPDGGTLSIETSNVYLDDEYTEALTGLIPGRYLLLAVSDTGTGISTKDLEHVFEPFFTTKDVGMGTGLGLSMVYGFAKQSGGHATIYSEIGYGTTVKIYLPQTDHLEITQKKTAHLDFKSDGEVILVVEDDPDMRSLTVALLTNMGYTVKSAENGPSALLELKNIPHLDILLTDLVLPGGINGVELSHKIKAHIPTVKILLMSGYTESAFSNKDLNNENTTLLQKPFRRADLAEKLLLVLDKVS